MKLLLACLLPTVALANGQYFFVNATVGGTPSGTYKGTVTELGETVAATVTVASASSANIDIQVSLFSTLQHVRNDDADMLLVVRPLACPR